MASKRGQFIRLGFAVGAIRRDGKGGIKVVDRKKWDEAIQKKIKAGYGGPGDRKIIDAKAVRLIASTGSPASARKKIADYFYGSEKELKSIGSDTYKLIGKKGKETKGFRVVKKKGRFRFEEI